MLLGYPLETEPTAISAARLRIRIKTALTTRDGRYQVLLNLFVGLMERDHYDSGEDGNITRNEPTRNRMAFIWLRRATTGRLL
jgi:hypothetical protein